MSEAITRPLLKQQGSSVPDEAAKEIWTHVSDSIQSSLPDQAFYTWIKPLKPLEFVEGILKVQIPSKFYYDWIEGHYSSSISNALTEVLGPAGQLAYVMSNGTSTPAPKPAPPSTSQIFEAPPAHRPTMAPQRNGLPQNGHIQGRSSAKRDSGLNPRYVFETFIEGPQNSFARAAAQAVAKNPGSTKYNPLLIYGGVGLGKTHLIQAIGNEVLQHRPNAVIKYISSELFTQEFVEAIKENKAEHFCSKYRNVDVLLMDDVQFLVGRERTQTEFFHTFNALHNDGKQIILSSDKPPRELNGLDERLVSRFGWGLVCDVGPPDYDTRTAIIQRMSEEEGVYLEKDVLDYLAQNFTKNVREMQGALIRLLAHASLTGGELTADLARRALRDLLDNRERRVTVDVIMRVVAQFFNVAPDLLMAKIRTQPVARARMVAMALATRMTGLSLKQIGANFGKRDHTTVMHAREKVAEWEKEDDFFASTIEQVVQKIESESD